MHLKNSRILVFAGLLATSACMSDSVIDPSDQPDLPQPATLSVDFSFFEDRTPEPEGAVTSWTQAIQTIDLARSEMDVLDVPGALLREATEAPGTRDGQWWSWPFSTVIDGDPYDGQVRATPIGNQYEWNLFVSAPDHSPQLTDYLWAQGYTRADGFEGVWSIADASAASDTVVAQVFWALNAEERIDMTYSATDSSRWTLQRTSTGTILTYYNYDTPDRRVTWFGDGTGRSWTSATSHACWDADLHDVEC